MIRRLVQRLADRPAVFDLLRWILEGAYRGHASVLHGELSAAPGRILDIGCGTGHYGRFFSQDVYTGIDLSPAYISAARRKLPDHCFVVADATQIPFPAEQFGTAFVSGVLHHLPDHAASRVLAEVARVLTADGLLVVWEDIPSVSWWNLTGRLVHSLDLGHWIRSPDQYRCLLEAHFSVRSQRTMRSGFMDYVVFACTPRVQ